MQYKHVNRKLYLNHSEGLCPPPFLGSRIGLDVTVFPATENNLSDSELTAGNGKTTLVFKLLLFAIY